MQNNFHFLTHLAAELAEILPKATLVESFTQNKNELILGFALYDQSNFYIKADLNSDFTCLSFPTEFSRAKRHCPDVFRDEIIGEVVSHVYQFEFERAFSIVFKNGIELVFKLFGTRSNALIVKKDVVLKIFKTILPQDLDIIPSSFNRSYELDEETFSLENLKTSLPTLGKEVFEYIKLNQVEKLTQEEQWNWFLSFYVGLQEKKFYRCGDKNGHEKLLLFPVGNVLKEYTSALIAITDFYKNFAYTFYLERAKNQSLPELRTNLRKTNAYIQKVSQHLATVEKQIPHQQIADIIMANLYTIPAKTKQIELFDFYRNENISIALDDRVTPQKHAENLYRKAKNQHVEIAKLQENLKLKQDLFQKLTDKIRFVESCTDIRLLQKEQKVEKETVEKESPFKEYVVEDFRIYVGRNSKNNDELTLKFATKDDLWLHAKDASGSHVVIKTKTGKTTPKIVIEKAAQLAAFYSKRRNENMCPVMITEKKYVRKKKGMPAGAVLVEKERILLVEPAESV